MLRNSYARRGVSQSSIETVTEVTQVSLAGAKRSFVELEASSMDDESSEDYFPDDMSASSTSTNGGSSSSTASSNGSSSGRLKFVQFASHCAVVEIPHFDEYSDAQKMAMWNGSKKIRAMARINTAEFLFDGWSVETAAEEDQFVLVKGVAVHPAHVAKDRHKFLEGNKSATTEDEAEDQC
jgi:hypothetical protein